MQFHAHSRDAHRVLMIESARLKLYFLHLWVAEHPEEDPVWIFRHRIDLFRRSDLNEGKGTPHDEGYSDPRWTELEEKTLSLLRKCSSDRARFEEEAIPLWTPHYDAALDRDWNDWMSLPKTQCGSLRHDEVLNPDGSIKFHILNARSPKSLLDEPAYLIQCFEILMERTEKLYGAEALTTGTWLNCLEKWLRFFPDEWRKNMEEPNTDVQWHFGFWGQFVAADGTFNAKYARILRETGKMPYYPRRSRCSFQSMRAHLEEMKANL